MNRPFRLSLLLAPFVLGVASHALPGRAQDALPSRFAFADTSLMRDTLGLSFARLFPVADSLGLTPDSLRAWMIRFRLSIPRLLALSDSIGLPVDSVGPLLARERFNPLAARGASRANAFTYGSTYGVGLNQNTWGNRSTWSLTDGPLFLSNQTTIDIFQTSAGGRKTAQIQRQSTSEGGWRTSPNFSVGARAILRRFDDDNAGTLATGERSGDYQLSVRTKQQPMKPLTNDLNFFSGLIDLRNSSLVKRGVSGDVNGRTRWAGKALSTSGNWGVNGNVANSRLPSAIRDLRTSDLSARADGNIAAFQNAPIGFNLNFRYLNTRVESAAGTDSIARILTSNKGAEGTLRLKRDGERYVNLTGRIGRSKQSTGQRDDVAMDAVARWIVLGWAMDASYRDATGETDFIRRSTAGGYREDNANRSADASFQRALSKRVGAKLTGSIGLNQLRYVATAAQVSPPVDRDAYRQSYKLETNYNRSDRLQTAMTMEVLLNRSINIPSRSTSSNNDTRTYRGEWRWTYRMFETLTINQTNQIAADYRFFTFAPSRNDLSLDYNTITTLSAVLSPRFSLDMTHQTREQPKGNYTREGAIGETFKPADESRNFSLRSRVTYSPSSALSLSIEPFYASSDRDGTSNGELVPQRSSRQLNMAGSANLNFRLGQRGTLTGSISREFRAERSTTYQSGRPEQEPPSEQDFWNGRLELTWNL